MAKTRAARAPARKTAKQPKGERTAVWAEMTLTCSSCMSPLPLGRIAPEALCPACGAIIALSREDWQGVAKKSLAEVARSGEVKAYTNFEDRWTERVRFGRGLPTCPVDGAIVDLGGAGRCACGRAFTQRSADALARAIVPGAALIVGEVDLAFTPAEPVLFRCACGAALSTDGSARRVACASCGDVAVPRLLWEALHPIPARPRIHFVLGG